MYRLAGRNIRRSKSKETKVIGFDYKALNKKQQIQDRKFAYDGGDYRALNKQQQNQDRKFVVAEGTHDPTMSKPMLQH